MTLNMTVLRVLILIAVFILLIILVGFIFEAIEQKYDFRIPYARGVIPIGITLLIDVVFLKRVKPFR